MVLGDFLLCTSTHPFFAGWGPLQGHATSPYVQVIDCPSAETLFSQQGAAILDSNAAPGQSCPLCQSTNALLMSQSGTNTFMGAASEDYQLPGSKPLPDT